MKKDLIFSLALHVGVALALIIITPFQPQVNTDLGEVINVRLAAMPITHQVESTPIQPVEIPQAIVEDIEPAILPETKSVSKPKTIKPKEKKPEKKKDKSYKCHACTVNKREIPACVSTCTTGALSISFRIDVIQKAKKRLEDIKKEYPHSSIYGITQFGGLHVITLLKGPPEKFGLPG